MGVGYHLGVRGGSTALSPGRGASRETAKGAKRGEHTPEDLFIKVTTSTTENRQPIARAPCEGSRTVAVTGIQDIRFAGLALHGSRDLPGHYRGS